jgi:hypothetical protein
MKWMLITLQPGVREGQLQSRIVRCYVKLIIEQKEIGSSKLKFIYL